MDFYPGPYVYSHFIAAGVSFLVALLLIVRRRAAGENFLAIALLAGAWWALVGGLEIGVRDEGLRYLFARLGYIGSYSAIPLLLIFSLKYSGMDYVLTGKALVALWVVPVAMVALAATNGAHHLIWTGILPIDEKAGIYRFYRGPAYWFGVIFNYLALALISVLLLRKTLRSQIPLYRRQALIVFVGIIPPWVANVLYLFKADFLQGLDLTPHAFAITGVVMAVGILRYRFMDLSPVARSLLFRKLPDAILVLDENLMVIDANEASESIVGRGLGDMIGQAAAQVMAEFPFPMSDLGTHYSVHIEAGRVLADGVLHSFDIEGISFPDPQGHRLGFMIQFRDITERKRIELEERDQRLLAEAMQNIALTITSTFDIDQVLETVADNMYRCIPSLVCSILLQGQDGKLQLATARGSPHAELRTWLDNGRVSIKTIRNFRLMAETGQALIVPDILKMAEWVPLDPRIRSWVCAPIRIMGEIIGFLSFDHDQPGFYNEMHAQRLKAFADLAAIIIKHARMYHENEVLANTDPLTGLSNRRHFFGMAENELVRTRRYGGALSLLMIDLDHLKELNDQCGHHVGDRAILEASKTLRAGLRDHDLCARFGGDEFCILLPETDIAGALGTAKRLVEEVRLILLGPETCGLNLSLSVGVACLQTQHADVDALMVEADRALYRAKANGRDQASI